MKGNFDNKEIHLNVRGLTLLEIYKLIRTGVRMHQFNASPLDIAEALRGHDIKELSQAKEDIETELRLHGVDLGKL